MDFTPASWRGWRVFAWRKCVCQVTSYLLLLDGYYSSTVMKMAVKANLPLDWFSAVLGDDKYYTGMVMKMAGFPREGKCTTWLIFCCSWWRQLLHWHHNEDGGFSHKGKSTTWLILCCSWWQILLGHGDEDGGFPGEGSGVAGGTAHCPAIPGRPSGDLHRGQVRQEIAAHLEYGGWVQCRYGYSSGVWWVSSV